ncbi:alpha/beta hydrolase [Candidatus Saccharibacteria bacterium]|nr:alpha/beta hydrolase [Candidatus Saccharibacteria bacterium]
MMAQKSLDLQEKTVKMLDWTKSGDIYYYESQDFDTKKPTLLMVHGFRGDHHGLQFVAEEFAELDQGEHNIMLIDLPAYGKSAEFINARNHVAAHYADFLNAFLQKIELESPIMLAHSFGTTVLSRFLANHSGRVAKKVILLAPIAKRPQLIFGTGVNNAMVDFVLKLPNKLTHSIASSKFVSDRVSASYSKTKDRRIYKNVTKAEHRKYFGVFSSMEAMMSGLKSSQTDSISDVIADLARADKDYLMILGTRDKLVTIDDARWLKDQLRAQMTEITDLGHLIHYEAPDEIARRVHEFLGEEKKER